MVNYPPLRRVGPFFIKFYDLNLKLRTGTDGKTGFKHHYGKLLIVAKFQTKF
ncbi:conserved hypothetical protein [Treponema phagedenis]|uniref:Uncharacterized protein n=1 Tax=Treponema phagedenis TaxID=162 RepID=A0A0B7GZ78_TREPH|nr:conserved hypothetical protein [Treponema phagedenis]